MVDPKNSKAVRLKLFQLADDQQMVKPSAMLLGKNSLSILGHRIMNALLHHAVRRFQEDSQWFTIPTGELMESIGWGSSHNVPSVKKALDELSGIVLVWGELDGESDWGKSALLADIKWTKRKGLQFTFSQTVREILFASRFYVVFPDLPSLMRLNRNALILYENLVPFWKEGPKEVSLETLRAWFGYENRYKQTRDFVNKVIKLGVEEINAKTHFDMHFEVKGRYRSHQKLIFEVAQRSWPGETQAIMEEIITLGVQKELVEDAVYLLGPELFGELVDQVKERVQSVEGTDQAILKPANYLAGVLRKRMAERGGGVQLPLLFA